MNEFTIRKPDERAHTLVAQFLSLRLDRVLERAHASVGENATRESVLDYLSKRYPDASATTHSSFATLILGGTLPEYFTSDELTKTEVLDERTVRITPVAGTKNQQLGDLLNFEATLWVVVSLNDTTIVLKRARSANQPDDQGRQCGLL